jgi:hypothetical protein
MSAVDSERQLPYPLPAIPGMHEIAKRNVQLSLRKPVAITACLMPMSVNCFVNSPKVRLRFQAGR